MILTSEYSPILHQPRMYKYHIISYNIVISPHPTFPLHNTFPPHTESKKECPT